MGWLIFFAGIALWGIAAAINSSNKEKEKAAHRQAQIAVNASRAVSVQSGDATYRWTLVPQSMEAMEQSFVLTAENGPSYNFSLRNTLSGVKLFINEREVAKGGALTMTDNLPFSLNVMGRNVSGYVVNKTKVTSDSSVALYLEDQFVGEVFIRV